jgi:predicted CXXCH cytochrome family protein
VYFLIRRKIGSGAGEALDSEYDTGKLTLRGDTAGTLQLPGLPGSLEIVGSGGGAGKFTARKLACTHNGESSRKGQLNVGDILHVPGFQLEVIAAPQGFDFALQIAAEEKVAADMFGTALSLHDTGWNTRRTGWILAVLVLLVGLVLPGLGLLSPELNAVMRSTPLPDDSLWSSGPLVAAHQTAGVTAECEACHTTPFVMVEDAACLDCHRDMTEHVDLAGHAPEIFIETRCATCHREHNEPGQIVQRNKGLCVDCHSDLDSMALAADNALQSVDGFAAGAHPEFRMALLQPKGPGGAHGWEEKRVRMSQEPLSESSNLKFTHTVHLDSEKVQEESNGEGLVCASCHTLKDDGEHFEPVTMDNHCRSCHGLNFDVFDPELELPHGDLRAAIVAMEAHFIREFTDPALRQERAATKPRRIPGKRDSAATCDGNGLECGRAEAMKEAEYQFANTGCITCHEVLDTGLKDINDRWYVQPVRITNDWFPHSRFDHASHLSLVWDEPGEVCESCHEASASEFAADILIPGQDNCLGCHAEDSGASVAVDCVSCHGFHKAGATLSTPARMAHGKEMKP